MKWKGVQREHMTRGNDDGAKENGRGMQKQITCGILFQTSAPKFQHYWYIMAP